MKQVRSQEDINGFIDDQLLAIFSACMRIKKAGTGFNVDPDAIGFAKYTLKSVTGIKILLEEKREMANVASNG